MDVLETFERDGFKVTIGTEPDDDYRLGDDDVYPVITEGVVEWVTCSECDGYGEIGDGETVTCPICDGEGELIDPAGIEVTTRSGPAMVAGAEVERLIRAGWGENPTDEERATARKSIAELAEGLASELLTFVGVIVKAERAGITGTASLWGIEADARKNPGGVLWCDLVDLGGELADEAISEATEKLRAAAASFERLQRRGWMPEKVRALYDELETTTDPAERARIEEALANQHG